MAKTHIRTGTFFVGGKPWAFSITPDGFVFARQIAGSDARVQFEAPANTSTSCVKAHLMREIMRLGVR